MSPAVDPSMPAQMPGKAILLSCLWQRVPPPLSGKALKGGIEVRLRFPPTGHFDLTTDSSTFGVRPASPEDERKLDEIRAADPNCVVVTAHPMTPRQPSPNRSHSASGPDEPFTLRVHLYAPAVGLALPLDAGLRLDIGDAVVEDAKKYAERADTASVTSVIAFLTRELLVAPRPGASANARRMVVSAAQREASTPASGCMARA